MKKTNKLAQQRKDAVRLVKFVNSYCISFNATKAWIAAGGAVKSAGVEGCKYLNKPIVSEAIEKRKVEILESVKLGTIEYWSGMSKLYRFDISDCYENGVLKDLDKMPEEARWCLSKVKNTSKITNEGKDAFASSEIEAPNKLAVLQEVGRALKITGPDKADPNALGITQILINVNYADPTHGK